MNKVAVIVFNAEGQAYEGSRAIHDLHREGSITRYSDAVITKDASGKVSLKRAADADPIGTLSGLLFGSMVGLLGGPVGFAVGAGAGTMIGATFDLVQAGIGYDFIDDVSEFLVPGKSAVITEIDEEWEAPLDTRMEALGGRIFRRNRIQVEDAYFEKEIAGYQAELEALEAEWEKASADRKARMETRIQDTRQKLQAKQGELQSRIDAVKREGEARIESLQQQIATARGEHQERLKKRLEKVRAEYQERSAKLHHAWELTKSALTP